MERFGKQVTPDQLKDLQRQLYIHSGWLGAHVEELRREHQSTLPENWTRDTFWKTHRWPQFVVTGYFLADAILGTLEIPPGNSRSRTRTLSCPSSFARRVRPLRRFS